MSEPTMPERQDLRERLTEALNTTLVMSDDSITRATTKWDRHDRHNFLSCCAACRGDVPAMVTAVLTVLAGDPGDLPARMAEAIDRTWTSEEDFDAEKAASAAMGVRDEQMASLAARLEHALAELSSLRDHRARWETEKARADKAEAERDVLAAAAKKTLEIRQTHHRTAHPTRLIDPDCLVCQMGLALSRDLPGVPDDLDELVRRLDDLNAEETTNV